MWCALSFKALIDKKAPRKEGTVVAAVAYNRNNFPPYRPLLLPDAKPDAAASACCNHPEATLSLCSLVG